VDNCNRAAGRPRPEPGRVRLRIVVRGVVQGVGYRYSLATRADRLGVGGWVRNRADGAVEAVLEGGSDAVESLVRWCARGPRGALVEHVEVTEEQPEGLRSFSVSP
jgi:acylphosphatase